MKKQNKGFIIPVLIGIIALLAIGGGVYLYENKKAEPPVPVEDNEAQPSIPQNPPVSDSQKPVQDSTRKPVVSVKAGISQTPKNIPKAHNAFGFDLIKSIKIGYLPVLRQTPLQPDINEVLGSDHPQGCKRPTLIPAMSQVMQDLGA